MRRHLRRKYDQDMIWSRRQNPGPFSFVLILDHLKAGFNVPKIIRSANAFGCREIHLIAIPPFDPNPAKGTLAQTLTRSFDTFDASYNELKDQGYGFFALVPQGENILGEFPLPQKVAFILGHEEYGLSFNVHDYPSIQRMKIQQYGQVDSLNVSIAASVAAFEYVRQNKNTKGSEP